MFKKSILAICLAVASLPSLADTNTDLKTIIDNHWQKMHDDHTRAKELAAALAGHAKVKAVEPVETNILIFSLNDDVKETDFMAKLKANDIHISSMGQGKLRIVTHYDYTAAMHDKFLEFLS